MKSKVIVKSKKNEWCVVRYVRTLKAGCSLCKKKSKTLYKYGDKSNFLDERYCLQFGICPRCQKTITKALSKEEK